MLEVYNSFVKVCSFASFPHILHSMLKGNFIIIMTIYDLE